MATSKQLLLVKQCYLLLVLCALHIKSSIQIPPAGVNVMDISRHDRNADRNTENHRATRDNFIHVKDSYRNTISVGGNNIMTARSNKNTPAENVLVEHSGRIDDDLSQCSLCHEMASLCLDRVPGKHRPQETEFSGPHATSSKLTDDSGCCRVHGTLANCSFCGLVSIPKALPTDITALLLGHNDITSDALGPRAFSSYPKLAILSLATNKISSLPTHAFESLTSLQCLYLQNNAIKMDGALNSSLAFQSLGKSLVYLKLNRNNKNVTDNDLMYPSYALSFLTNLKYLYLDGIPFKRFENPYQDYGKLTHLTLAGFNEGHCNLTGLQKHVFELVSLKYLDISDCLIDGRYVNESAFENLENLQTLNVSNNFDLSMATVGDFMYGLRNNKNFETLVMQRINPRFTPCVAIYNETLRFFKNTGLKRIAAMDNKIEIIQNEALQMLPDTLQILNLTDNKIIFGEYIKHLHKLTNLEELVLDGSIYSYNFPNRFPTQRLGNCARDTGHHAKSVHLSSTEPVNIDPYIKFIPVPPKLKKLSMVNNRMVYTLNNLTFFSPNNLKSVVLDGNVFQKLIGPVRGLETLEVLSMDNCIINYLSPVFLDNFSGIRKLSFYRNLIGQSLYWDKNGSTFKNLKQLSHLNLTLNNIFDLSSNAFKSLNNLLVLDLSDNRLSQVNFSIAHMKKLQSLNLTKNQIRFLSPPTMAEIDEINKGRRHPLKLDLSYNPIGCFCEHLEFLEWLTESGTISDNFTNLHYYCDTYEQPNGYEEVIKSLRRECVKHSSIFVVVLCATFIAVLLLLVSLTYRFRWTLRYWYHVARITLQPSLPPHQFDYDVFISYNNKDGFVEEELIPRLQNDFNLRIHFHGLNFPAGGQIADSIHRAVTSSRKTLVVISRNMLRSHWCYYELMTARREGIARGRQVLVFFFLEPMSSWEMSSEIAAYVRESTYIAYPPDPAHRPAFWRKLADDLGADMPLP